MQGKSFSYRVLIVEDDIALREAGKMLLESRGYEVLTAGDGFEGLGALKRALPDIIISDLNMPNMSGFEFLAVVRRRFPEIPVIVISGEFTGLGIPESVLADAFFEKSRYKVDVLFDKILELLQDLPPRPRVGKPERAAVWVKNDKGIVAVTCTHCLRTFSVLDAVPGINIMECELCSGITRFEIVESY